jgi:hypothetical protein
MIRALLIGLALLLAVPAAAQPAAPKSLSVKLDGAVKAPATFTLAQLQAMPSVSIDVTYQGQAKSSWKGVSLLALIQGAGTIDEAGNNAVLRHVILAKGSDGYFVAIAIGEIEPDFAAKQAIVAYERDGKSLDGLRLVVPGDAHAGRNVRDLAEITVN